jgi:N12 class adenine-specific DNA methylase
VISLYEGFILWCKDAGAGMQSAEYGIQWSSITTSVNELKDYYLKPVSNPFSKEKNGEERWARYKDDARRVGERLFSQFLAEGLTPEDQMKVEYIWNSIYNSYVEPQLDEVPIGFTYKKYLDNRHLFLLKESNLRAIRYYLTRGSIGLAYGVGLGKTFCSIFAMKQALDLGTAERALVIVPNQVYFQFGQEIVRGLGADFDPTKTDGRLNMFYNGSGIYNQLGNNAVNGINLCTYEATGSFQFAKENIDYTWVEEAVSILEMGGEVQSEPIVEGFLKAHSKSLFNEESIESNKDESDEYVAEPTNEDFSDEDDLGGFKEGGKVPRREQEENPIILNSASTNFDMVVVDEAHNFNNLFTAVVAEPKKVQAGNKDKKSFKKCYQ